MSAPRPPLYVRQPVPRKKTTYPSKLSPATRDILERTKMARGITKEQLIAEFPSHTIAFNVGYDSKFATNTTTGKWWYRLDDRFWGPYDTKALASGARGRAMR